MSHLEQQPTIGQSLAENPLHPSVFSAASASSFESFANIQSQIRMQIRSGSLCENSIIQICAGTRDFTGGHIYVF